MFCGKQDVRVRNRNGLAHQQKKAPQEETFLNRNFSKAGLIREVLSKVTVWPAAGNPVFFLLFGGRKSACTRPSLATYQHTVSQSVAASSGPAGACRLADVLGKTRACCVRRGMTSPCEDDCASVFAHQATRNCTGTEKVHVNPTKSAPPILTNRKINRKLVVSNVQAWLCPSLNLCRYEKQWFLPSQDCLRQWRWRHARGACVRGSPMRLVDKGRARSKVNRASSCRMPSLALTWRAGT